MRIEIRPNINSNTPQQGVTRQQHFLKAEGILSYLKGNNEKIETLIICKPEDIDIITTDYELYQALGSTKPDDNIKLNRLTKLVEVVTIFPYKELNKREKPILKEERVEELRRQVLSDGEEQTWQKK